MCEESPFWEGAEEDEWCNPFQKGEREAMAVVRIFSEVCFGTLSMLIKNKPKKR